MKILRIIISFFLLNCFLFGITQEKSSVFLPNKKIVPQLYLDPLECQIYGGITRLFEKEVEAVGVYLPFNLGFSVPLYGKNANNYNYEIGFEVAAYSQFNIHEVEEGVLLGGMLNIDYKASSYFAIQKGRLTYRLRLFHISSHLGDDYLIRNEIFTRNDQSVNYEQLDFTVFYNSKYGTYYGGIGEVVSPNAYRKRYSMQFGYQGTFETKKEWLSFVGALDLKSFAQNDFYPNSRTGVGLAYNVQNEPKLIVMLEYYNGHLPYSTLEYRKVQWFGVSSVLSLK